MDENAIEKKAQFESNRPNLQTRLSYHDNAKSKII
jgi:hypothetical protein